jgi:hypothetical protein
MTNFLKQAVGIHCSCLWHIISRMVFLRWLCLLAAVLLLISGTILLGWRFWPVGSQQVSVPFAPEHQIHLKAPERMRVGGVQVVQLKIQPAEGTGDDSGLNSSMTVVEARLEVAGLAIEPGPAFSQPITPASEIMYEWRVVAGAEGKYAGELWVFRQQASDTGVDAGRQPVLAYPLQIRAARLFGLDAQQALLFGGLCVILGLPLALTWWRGRSGRPDRRFNPNN